MTARPAKRALTEAHEIGYSPTDSERFAKFWMPEPNSGCWLWIGGMKPGGYGVFRLMKRDAQAHRAAVAIHRETVPAHLQALHKCNNKACVNPDHIYLGTRIDNAQDAIRSGAMPWQKNPVLYSKRAAVCFAGRRIARGDDNGARKYPERLPRGEQNGRAKLTAADVVAIRLSVESGPVLAQRLNVSVNLINKVKRRKVWRHVI